LPFGHAEPSRVVSAANLRDPIKLADHIID